MTERLYYNDSYLRRFSANIAARSGDGLTVYLDRTAFYPTSGGQPFDTGVIGGSAVVEVAEEGERIAHRVATPVAADAVECEIDWPRRFDHMQQHTGQHLLSAVFDSLFGLRTVSFHLGAEICTIDLEGGEVTASTVREAERRANELVCENRPVAVGFEDAAEAEGLRKASEREGTLRIVSIDSLDRSACGGTHVRYTGEIGPILARKVEKVRQTWRVEFVCGMRAIARARADYDALAKTAQLFSSALDQVPAFAASQIEAAHAAEKAVRKLTLELALRQGKELYDATEPGADGVRRISRRIERGSLEELRAVAQSFTTQAKAVFVAALEDPPSLLIAASEDSGVDAGKALKAALAEAGGRGGGNARVAQGSVADRDGLARALARL